MARIKPEFDRRNVKIIGLSVDPVDNHARWADDIRMQAKLQREVKWHYINFPFKPAGEPEDIKPLPPDPDNIISAVVHTNQIRYNSAAESSPLVTLLLSKILVFFSHQPDRLTATDMKRTETHQLCLPGVIE